MRQLKGHTVNPVNEKLEITVMDQPGAGGAHHHYEVRILQDVLGGDKLCDIRFQNGPIKENGVNGLTQEALIAICIDRLECFQAGAYACQSNALALHHLREAQEALHSRTRERLQRGVEGTHQK